MKIVVFADSHTDVDSMVDIVKIEKPNVVIHLGDHIRDAHEMQKRIDADNIEMHFVVGNTDPANEGDAESIIRIEGKVFYISHGHAHRPEFFGPDEIFHEGAALGADIILFGHTHEPYLYCSDGTWIMNPGRIGRISRRRIYATYGVIFIEESKIRIAISEAGVNKGLHIE